MSNDIKHIEYFLDFISCLKDAKCYYDMKEVVIMGTEFIGMLNSLKDDDKIDVDIANGYIISINILTEDQLKIFLN